MHFTAAMGHLPTVLAASRASASGIGIFLTIGFGFDSEEI
jgi:hypothetical protein